MDIRPCGRPNLSLERDITKRKQARPRYQFVVGAIPGTGWADSHVSKACPKGCYARESWPRPSSFLLDDFGMGEWRQRAIGSLSTSIDVASALDSRCSASLRTRSRREQTPSGAQFGRHKLQQHRSWAFRPSTPRDCFSRRRSNISRLWRLLRRCKLFSSLLKTRSLSAARPAAA